MSKYISWARRVADGLSSLWDRAASRLAGSRFNPSRIWGQLRREPFGLAGFVIFVTLAVHYGGTRLWTLPITLAGAAAAIIGDELWQDRLGKR